MDMDEAFPQRSPARRHRLEVRQPALRSRADGEDRVHHQAHVDAALRQLRHDRVDQERHVVVDDLEDRDVLEPVARDGAGRGLEPDLAGAGLADGEQRPGPLRQRRDLARPGRRRKSSGTARANSPATKAAGMSRRWPSSAAAASINAATACSFSVPGWRRSPWCSFRALPGTTRSLAPVSSIGNAASRHSLSAVDEVNRQAGFEARARRLVRAGDPQSIDSGSKLSRRRMPCPKPGRPSPNGDPTAKQAKRGARAWRATTPGSWR